MRGALHKVHLFTSMFYRLLDIAESSGYISPQSSKDVSRSTSSSQLLSESPSCSLNGENNDKIEPELNPESEHG